MTVWPRRRPRPAGQLMLVTVARGVLVTLSSLSGRGIPDLRLNRGRGPSPPSGPGAVPGKWDGDGDDDDPRDAGKSGMGTRDSDGDNPGFKL